MAQLAKIRPVAAEDLDALYAISLATGDRGADASHLYGDPRLIGHLYSVPYALLEPDLAFVAEDAAGVGGFVLGVLDTVAWQDRLEKEWYPPLRTSYPDPSHIPQDARSADQRRAAMIHHPVRTPDLVSKQFPAHLHLNLLPRLQGKGLGSALFEHWLAAARKKGAAAVHVGVNKRNARALRFWTRQGFTAIEAAEAQPSRTRWLGRRLGSTGAGEEIALDGRWHETSR